MPWNYDDDEINGIVDANMKDSPPNPPAVNSAASVRGLFKAFWGAIRGQVSTAVQYIEELNSSEVIQAALVQAEAVADQVDNQFTAIQTFRDQAQQAAQTAVNVTGDFDQKGFYNATTNQANNATTLTADSSAWRTNPNKLPSLDITTPGPAVFAGDNFAVGTVIGPGSLRGTAANKWYFKSDGIADGGVTIQKLGSDVKAKNLPFSPTATIAYGSKARTAIQDIKLYNVDPSKQYFVGVFAKKPSGSTQYVLHIYQYNSPSNSVYLMGMTASGYVPSAYPEVIRFQGPGNQFAMVTVNWNLVEDGASETNMTPSHTGISPLTYRSQDDYAEYLNRKLESLPPLRATYQRRIVSKVETLSIQNTENRTVQHANMSAVIISFKTNNQDFNLFSFPGHNFATTKAKYAFCIVKTAAGEPEFHFQPFDKRTADYEFQMSRMINLKETVKITFGYLDASFKSFQPGVNISWGSGPADANLAPATISYLNLVQDPFSNGTVAAGGWNATAYKLSKASNVVVSDQQRDRADVRFVLPSKFYLLADSTLWFYANNIIKYFHVYNKKPYGFQMVSRLVSNGSPVTSNYQYSDEEGQIMGAGSPVNLTFSIYDYEHVNSIDEPDLISSKVVNCTPKVRPTGQTLNGIFIGDSFEDSGWEGRGILQEISTLATGNGNTINWKGIRTPNYGGGAIKSEARGGWTEGTFFRYVPIADRADVNAGGSNLHSPFMFSPDDTAANAYFSFSEYMTTYAIGALDFIIIALGTNPSTPSGAKIAEMVASIRAYSATIPIIICTVPPASISRRNIDTNLDQNRKLSQTEAYLTLFDNREAEKIYICPWHMSPHRLYAMQTTSVDVTQYPTENMPSKTLYLGGVATTYKEKQSKLYLSDIHPSALGVRTYAYLGYDAICYAQA
ncbi:hypothetical protein SAMN04487996_12259 [Dyadobacter soli]|uniref:GDSL-like Lipase/Acylhydrolase family protein n=1 Tax=Dyadobacter soli TaxID=659014 RepID=A0A1G7WIC6_9BACT|nr:SGNH/GDSL hydrolase family protein [Dyadobacter soli]SDG71757.1 hypothetical protein SAMN04487996_12259 [Dyadobacter soli]